METTLREGALRRRRRGAPADVLVLRPSGAVWRLRIPATPLLPCALLNRRGRQLALGEAELCGDWAVLRGRDGCRYTGLIVDRP